MEYVKGKMTKLLVDFFEQDFRRITHALNVLKYAEMLMDPQQEYDYDIIVASALLHDVGIKPSEEELGYNNGKTQEQYGPAVVEKLLQGIDFPPEKIKIVSEIVGNHHSPSRYDYVELSILKDADKVVNQQESSASD